MATEQNARHPQAAFERNRLGPISPPDCIEYVVRILAEPLALLDFLIDTIASGMPMDGKIMLAIEDAVELTKCYPPIDPQR